MPEAADAGKADFFISRAGADAGYAAVIGKILEDAHYNVILQDWDFADKNFVERMHDALIRAERVILLLSPEYLKSPYCTAEWVNAIAGDPLNRGSRLILFRVRECAPEGMLKGLAYRDLLPLRDHASRLREYILDAVRKDAPRTAPDKFFRPAKTVLHDRIRAVPNFTGRREDLAALDRTLWDGQTAVITQAAVQGLGGVGKSTLAIQYAFANRERYAGVWWLGADTEAAIVDGLLALGATFIPGLNEAKDRAEAAHAALKFIADGGFEKPWLLLYDNVEQPKALDGLLPRAGAQVLITTRFPDWKGRAAAIPLGVFASDEAVLFLLDRTDRTDKEGAARLAADLGHLPLALDHSAAYCKRTGTSFDKYRELLPELIKRAPKDADYPKSVYATFILAIGYAAADCADAGKLMAIFAYLASDDIPLSLISAEVMSEIARGGAVAALYEVSLLELENEAAHEATIRVHRLAQTVMRDFLANQGKAEGVAAIALMLVAKAFPSGDVGPDDARSWAACATLRPHALSVLQVVADDGPYVEKKSRLLNQLAVYLTTRAEHHDAEPLMRAALQTAEQSYGPEHPNVAARLGNLGHLLQETNQLQEAEPLMRRALEIDEGRLGPDHPSVARDLNNLARLLQATNQLQEAEPLMRRALEIDEKSFGPDHPKVAIKLNNLAVLLEEGFGNREDSERMKRRALSIWETAFGKDHPIVATALNNLARLLQTTNQLQEAEPLMRRALEIDEGRLGPDHPSVARNLNNLATLLKDTNRLEEAMPLMRRALEVFTVSLGPDHPNTKTVESNYGLILEAIEARKP